MKLPRRLHQSVYFFAGALVVAAVYFTVVVGNRLLSNPSSAPLQVPQIGFEVFKLANGLQVLVHRDTTAPSVAIEVWYHVGSKDEPPGKAGLAHLAEHLLFSPNERTGAGMAADFQRLGAWDYNALTSRDRTRFLMTVPKTALNAALWLESERMSVIRDHLTEKMLDEARQTLLNEIRRNESDGTIALEMALAKAAFPSEHPYSHPPGGDSKDIDSISLEDITRWLGRYYTPSNGTVVVAGDVDPANVRDIAETHFGSIPRGNRPPRWTTWVTAANSSRHYLVETPASAPKAGMIWVVPGYGSPEADYLDLARPILESRLVSALVGDAASSITAELQVFELCGLFTLTITRASDAADAEIAAEVGRQIDKLVNEGPSASELEQAKRLIITSLLYDCERVGGASGKAGILALSQVLAGDPGAFNQSVVRIQKASTDEVKRVLSSWISSRTPTRFTIQPAEESSSASFRERPRTMPAINWADTASSPALERFELGNGLTVILIRRSGPIEGVKVVWPAPSNPARSEDAMFRLTHSLLSQGPSDSTAAQRLREKQRNLDSRFIIDSEAAHCSIGLELPRGNLTTALEILSLMVTKGSFDQKRIDRSRRELRLEYDDRKEGPPRRAALNVLKQLLFAESRNLGPAGEIVRAADSARIEEFYRRWFNPGRATLVVAADINPDSLRPTLESLFGSWPAFDQPVEEASAESIRNAPVYLIDRPGSEYVVVACSAALPNHETVDRHAVELMTEVLNSRVGQKLRAREQLSYEAIAYYEGWPREHVVTLLADARYDHVQVIVRALRQEVSALGRAEPFSKDELNKARDALSKRISQSFESTSLVLNAAAKAARANRASLPSAKEILDVSDQDARVAASLFGDVERYVWVIAGDSTRIADLVQRLGHGTEVIPAKLWSPY